MRTLIFGAILLAVAAAGFHTLISSSLAAARDARAATFSERFAPVLSPPALSRRRSNGYVLGRGTEAPADYSRKPARASGRSRVVGVCRSIGPANGLSAPAR
jgi:hypothetical protein